MRGRWSNIEKGVTHAVLIAGCCVFAFPFVWMVMTSFKVPREMSAAEIRWLPRPPVPQPASPYIDPGEFDPPELPDAMAPALWEQAKPAVDGLLQAKLEQWAPVTTVDHDAAALDIGGTAAYMPEMTEGLHAKLYGRISDEARQSDADAVLADVERIVDDRLMAQVLDACYRRLCLGAVRVRTTDYNTHSLYPEARWRVAEGDATLVDQYDGGGENQEARFTLTDDTGVAFAFLPRSLPADPDAIDRLYIQYRSDESWAPLSVEVVRDSVLYRSTEPIYMFDRTWVEQEFRWPGGEGDSLERRTYQMLTRVGAAPAGSPPFEVRIALTKNTPAGAWLAKLQRNYRQAFREVPFARYIMTSTALVLLNVLLAILSCTLVGYAFARLEWPGRDLCFALLLATMMMPPQVTMIPGFLIMKHLGWFNTLLPLWVPAGFGAPLWIFLVRQFLKNIPGDLEDAARVDGCGFLRIYWHVMLPLVKPTMAAIAVFTAMGTWNNFMSPLIFVNDERLFPLALGLFKFNLRSGGDVGLMMAGAFLMTLPIILLFFFVQRYFIQGISLTGTKG